MPATLLTAVQSLSALDVVDHIRRLWDDGYWIYVVLTPVLAYLFRRRWQKLNRDAVLSLSELPKMKQKLDLLVIQNQTQEQRNWLNERRIEMLEGVLKSHSVPIPEPFAIVAPQTEEKP